MGIKHIIKLNTNNKAMRKAFHLNNPSFFLVRNTPSRRAENTATNIRRYGPCSTIPQNVYCKIYTGTIAKRTVKNQRTELNLSLHDLVRSKVRCNFSGTKRAIPILIRNKMESRRKRKKANANFGENGPSQIPVPQAIL